MTAQEADSNWRQVYQNEQILQKKHTCFCNDVAPKHHVTLGRHSHQRVLFLQQTQRTLS
jgi:hypothetical protein